MSSAAAMKQPDAVASLQAEPMGLLAVRLLALAQEAGPRGLIHVAGSDRRAERLGALLAVLAPSLDVIVVPAWDCLPYDRAAPSREVMGRRTVALRRLTERATAPRIVVTTPDALLQRVPPRVTWAAAGLTLKGGEAFDVTALEAYLDRAGYVLDERVDEPGEAAIRGGVIDVFPAGATTPFRLEHADGVIAAIRCYDPVSQRTEDETDELRLDPVKEIVPHPAKGEAVERFPGAEHWLPEFYPELETVFDYAPEAGLVLEAKADERRQAVLEQIADAYEGRTTLRAGTQPERRPLPPERLYLDANAWRDRLDARKVTYVSADEGDGPHAAPRFATSAQPMRAFADWVREAHKAGRRVVLAAGTEGDLQKLTRHAERAVERAPEPGADWDAVRAAPPGALLALRADLEAGFVDANENVTVIAAADVLGSRAQAAGETPAPSLLPAGDIELQLGDAVIHLDHGMGVLRDLEIVTAGETAQDALRLDYKDDAKLLAPVAEIERVWRYASEAETVSLDRLDSESWPKRRAEVEAAVAESARRLVDLAREREATAAPKLTPPRAAYERFAARFPFSETPDQARAIAAALADLAAGRPMDRLVCGDVGFGKTEVALRAAAAAALAGKQVAVVAPTTVLVRQHLQTFRRRFAGLGVDVAGLSRLVKPAEAKRVKAALADGSVRIVVGTHAVAAKGIRFKDLGLVVIDEEQRFGAAHKAKLRSLAKGLHVLTLTATPIPRTLQAALVGLQDLSVIATPPAQRRPIRTFLTPFDPMTVREALVRERRRGGQSFVVCPRVEDIGPMAKRLAELVPELDVMVAHGKMPADEIDDSMVRFAEGEGDVLLATNIIESGLDVPRANTMLVWRADRFGLAQLHQLRGRVGRGRARGIAYLLTDPAHKIAASTRKRLETLEALDRLGAGFAISARDLDIRGAGDLLGEEQAGHVKLIGLGLYQHLLERAVRAARGEAVEDWTPELNLGLNGLIPADYVPEPEVRINLYARLAKTETARDIDLLRDEIEDRFGPPPEAIGDLIALARLRALSRRLGVARVDAGPKAIALTFRDGMAERFVAKGALEPFGDGIVWRDGRLIVSQPSETALERQRLTADVLEQLAER